MIVLILILCWIAYKISLWIDRPEPKTFHIDIPSSWITTAAIAVYTITIISFILIIILK